MLALDLAHTEALSKEKDRKPLAAPSSPPGSNEEVLEHFSKGLRDALSEDNHAKTLQLCKLAKNLPKASYDVFYELILDFFSVGNQHVQLAVHAIEDELMAQKTGIILREESVASELLTRIFFREDGMAYLQRAVLPTIKRIHNNKNSMRIDAVVDELGHDPEANLHILFFYCRNLVQQLIATVNYFPSQLISILRVLQTAAEKAPHHSESAKTVVSSLLFLRYICPSIVHPRLVGLQEELSASSTLALVNVAKIVQCAANHTHWNPEKAHKFIDTELQPLIDTLAQDVLFKSRSYYASVPQNSKPGVTSRALSKLVVYLGTNMDLYESVEEIRSIMAGYILWLEAASDAPQDSPPSPTPQPPDFPSPRRLAPIAAASPRPQVEDPRLIPLAKPLIAPIGAKAKLASLRASSVAITAAEKKLGPQVIQTKFFDALSPHVRRQSLDGFVPPPPSASTLLLDALPAAPVLNMSGRAPLAHQTTLRMSEHSIALAHQQLASIMGESGSLASFGDSGGSFSSDALLIPQVPAGMQAPPTLGAGLNGSASTSMPSLHVGTLPIPPSPLSSPGSSTGDASSADRTKAMSPTSPLSPTPTTPVANSSVVPGNTIIASPSLPVYVEATAQHPTHHHHHHLHEKNDKSRDRTPEKSSGSLGNEKRDKKEKKKDKKNKEKDKLRDSTGARRSKDRDSKDGARRDSKESRESPIKDREKKKEKKERSNSPLTVPPNNRTRRHSFDALSGLRIGPNGPEVPPATTAASSSARTTTQKRVSGDVTKEAKMARNMIKDSKGEVVTTTINPLRKDLIAAAQRAERERSQRLSGGGPVSPDRETSSADSLNSETSGKRESARPPSGLLSKLLAMRRNTEDELPLSNAPSTGGGNSPTGNAPLSARLTQAPMPKVPSGERNFKGRKAQFADDTILQDTPTSPTSGKQQQQQQQQHAQQHQPPQPDAPTRVTTTRRRSLSGPMAPPSLPLKKTTSNPQVSQATDELRALVSTVNRQIVREIGIVGPPLTVHQPLPYVFVTSWICAREVVHFATLPRCLLSILFLDGAASLGALTLRPESELVQSSLQDEEFNHRALVRVFSAAPQAGESISEEASKQLIRRFHWWCLSASHVKGHTENSPGRPFNPDLLPEIIALFVYVHYINRVMLAVFGRKTWVQDWLGTLVRPAMRASRKNDMRRAGESLLLVPGRQAPLSVQVWASHSPILGRVYAVFAGALQDAVQQYVPTPQLQAFASRVQRWNGAPYAPTQADIDADCPPEVSAAVRASYALMLRTAFEPAQATTERRAFREYYTSSAALLAVSAHAAMQAALHVGALAA